MKKTCVIALLSWTITSPLLAGDVPPPNLTTRSDLWPREVTLTTAIAAPLMIDGKSVGTASVPTGTRLPLMKVEGNNVHLAFNGTPVVTPVANTDLIARTEQIQKFQAQRASQLAAAPTPPEKATTTAVALGPIAKELKGALVSLQKGTVTQFNDAGLAKAKYIAIYFSASWCPPCRKFTPDLVTFYNEFKPQHPNFELVFVSWDRAAGDMEKYMETDSMPWPALKFSEIKSKHTITGFAGNGIPCLVLVDSNGKVLSDSYENGKYVGPRKVLQDIVATVGAR